MLKNSKAFSRNARNIELNNNQKTNHIKIKDEPNDWSKELTEIDSIVKRLNWSRDDEIDYLEKNLGYNNRNKITKYSELIDYLNLLKLEKNINEGSETINHEKLMEESERFPHTDDHPHSRAAQMTKTTHIST